MKRYLTIVSILICSFLFGQNKKLDSLWVIYNRVGQPDTNRLKAIDAIAFIYSSNNPDSAILLASQERQLAEKLKLNNYVARSLKTVGQSYINKENYAKAVDFFLKALNVFGKTDDKLGQAKCYSSIGNIYFLQSDYPNALEFFLKSLKIEEELGYKQGVGGLYNNIGSVYFSQSEYSKALEYYQKALKIDSEGDSKISIGNDYNNMGNVYQNQANYPKAMECYSNSLKLFEEAANKSGIANCCSNIGNIYELQSNFPKALEYQLKSIRIGREIGNKEGLGNYYNNISNLYIKMSEFNLAIQYSDSGLQITKELGDIDLNRMFYSSLATAYASIGHYKEAYDNHVQFKLLTDSVFNSDKSKQLGDLKTKFEVEKKEAELKSKEVVQQAISIGVVGVLIIVLIFSIFLYRRFKITQQQKAIIEQKNLLVEEKQKEIVDSITYAKRLQQGILPPLNQIQHYFPDSFVLYKPKDIVSGDFYWMHATGGTVLIAAADCTGHGVPGALVSVVCSNALNRTVKEFGLTDTGKILDKVTELVLETFEKSGETIRDGMDISLLRVIRNSSVSNSVKGERVEAQWSGANNPLWVIKGNELSEIKADKQPIGKGENRKLFTSHTLNLVKGETLYLITDGYADQFSGEGKKVMKNRFKDLLISIQNKSMDEQRKYLNEHHSIWKGNVVQTDDVTVIGLKI